MILSAALTDSVMVLASLGLTAVLLAVARIDAQTFRIPDAISLPLIAAGLGLAALQAGWLDHLIGALLGFAVLAGIGEAHFRRTGREGLGLGDAKLFAAAGGMAWLAGVAAGAAGRGRGRAAVCRAAAQDRGGHRLWAVAGLGVLAGLDGAGLVSPPVCLTGLQRRVGAGL